MKVTLLNYAQPTELYQEGTKKPIKDYEFLVRQAASVCVDKLDNPTEKGKMTALESGHLSILEHLPLTFLVEDVSRALTHQLVRHRIASYSQQSQRYAKVDTDKKWYVVPKSLNTFDASAGLLKQRYEEHMKNTAELYNAMCKVGIPNEDARFILPNACYTSIICSFNARAFVEAGQKRICNKAQWEIRAMFRQMRELIKDIYPTVYDMTKPNCQKGGCTEKKPCGKPYEG